MSSARALFRCDASPSIGGGHVSRCLALAEALHEVGWDVGFVVTEETIATAPALAAGGFAVRVLAKGERELEVLRAQGTPQADLLVIDHYDRDRQFESRCRPFASKILAIDDATGRDHDCDILVDAGAADVAIYAGHVPSHAAVLVGPAYALMRQAFIRHRCMRWHMTRIDCDIGSARIDENVTIVVATGRVINSENLAGERPTSALELTVTVVMVDHQKVGLRRALRTQDF